MIKKYIEDSIINIRNRKTRKVNPNPIKEWPLEVVSSNMGCDRGIPIDRYYIEKFLFMNKKSIHGNVMEIGDNIYTKKFGENIENSYILTADNTTFKKDAKIIYGDLQVSGEKDMVDCFILTQTLPFIYDIHSAAKNIINMLKNDGIALITVSGVSMLSEYDNSRWGHYWGFTELSLRRLFENFVPEKNIEIISMGNAKAASAFLYGLCVEDISVSDLDYEDKLVPVTIGALVRK